MNATETNLFKKDDRVYSDKAGWGTVTEVSDLSPIVRVRFDDQGKYEADAAVHYAQLHTHAQLHQAKIERLEHATGEKSPGTCAECGLAVEPLTAPYDSGRYFCSDCQTIRRLQNRDLDGEPTRH